MTRRRPQRLGSRGRRVSGSVLHERDRTAWWGVRIGGECRDRSRGALVSDIRKALHGVRHGWRRSLLSARCRASSKVIRELSASGDARRISELIAQGPGASSAGRRALRPGTRGDHLRVRGRDRDRRGLTACGCAAQPRWARMWGSPDGANMTRRGTRRGTCRARRAPDLGCRAGSLWCSVTPGEGRRGAAGRPGR